MEPETPAVNDLPGRWRREFALTAHDCADELEASLRAERAPHEEMARRTTEAFTHLLDPYIIGRLQDHIRAALASVERSAWQRCPENSEKLVHYWHSEHCDEPQPCSRVNEWGDYCNWCGVYRIAIERSAVEPAPVPQQGENQ